MTRRHSPRNERCMVRRLELTRDDGSTEPLRPRHSILSSALLASADLQRMG